MPLWGDNGLFREEGLVVIKQDLKVFKGVHDGKAFFDELASLEIFGKKGRTMMFLAFMKLVPVKGISVGERESSGCYLLKKDVFLTGTGS